MSIKKRSDAERADREWQISSYVCDIVWDFPAHQTWLTKKLETILMNNDPEVTTAGVCILLEKKKVFELTDDHYEQLTLNNLRESVEWDWGFTYDEFPTVHHDVILPDLRKFKVTRQIPIVILAKTGGVRVTNVFKILP